MSDHTPPHILCINHEYPPVGGGAATATLQVAHALARAGNQVTVLTSRYGDEPVHSLDNGVHVWRIWALRARADKSNPLEMLSFMLSSCGWALRWGRGAGVTASIAFFGLPAGPAAWLVRLLGGAPYVVSLRGGDVPGFLPDLLGRWHRRTGWLIRWLWKRARAVVANSEGLARLARRDGQDVLVIPNGVDSAFFVPRRDEDLPRPSPCTHLLHVGRLNKQKSLEILLEALPRLRGDWRLSLVGDGPEAAPLREKVRALGLAERVAFLGWQERSRMPRIYQEADIFVFPSVEEGMPNAMLEAMSCGLPVLACAVCGCEELVEHEHTGLLVPPRDVDALAAALQRLCAAPDERHRMGRAGREAVCRRFSWEATARAYARICTQGSEA